MPNCSICGKAYDTQFTLYTLDRYESVGAYVKQHIAIHIPGAQFLHATDKYAHVRDGDHNLLVNIELDHELIEAMTDAYVDPSLKDADPMDTRIYEDIAKRFTDFESRKIETCPHCGRKVIDLQQIGRCVYAYPCDCRLWQGAIPEAWRHTGANK